MTRRRSPQAHRRLRATLATLMGVAILAAPTAANAWDPSTTHTGMVERAAVESTMHRRWMDQSDLSRGLFSSVRLDPDDVDEQTRRMIALAIRRAHAASGARGLGGPGACPGPTAPPSTQGRCVEGDVWEMTALGWLKLGVVLELTPRARLLHHFVDRNDPGADTWSDPELPAAILRLKERRNGGSLARRINRTAFSGGAQSAVGWLSDAADLWAPPATMAHLERAALANTEVERQRELALGLLGVGALLHVVQDQSVPAHARGDVTAFFAPLSTEVSDRGLPLQEYARLLYGRHRLPRPLALSGRAPTANPPPSDLRALLLGEGDAPGLVEFAAGSFFSESSVPAPQHLDPGLSAEDAAAALLTGPTRLAADVVDGAVLAPWPAENGYLKTASGRGLAAFTTNEDGAIQLYLDRRIYRDQASHLIPRGIAASVAVLDLLFAPFPPTDYNPESGIVDIDLREHSGTSVLSVMREDGSGQRTPLHTVALREGQRNRIVDLVPPVPEDAEDPPRYVLVLQTSPAGSVQGTAQIVERRLVSTVNTPPPAAVAEPEPEPELPPAPTDIEPATDGDGPSRAELKSPFPDQEPDGDKTKTGDADKTKTGDADKTDGKADSGGEPDSGGKADAGRKPDSGDKPDGDDKAAPDADADATPQTDKAAPEKAPTEGAPPSDASD